MKRIFFTLCAFLLWFALPAQQIAIATPESSSEEPISTPASTITTLAGYTVVSEISISTDYRSLSDATIESALPQLIGDPIKGKFIGKVKVALVPIQDVPSFLTVVASTYQPITNDQMVFLKDFLCGTTAEALRKHGTGVILAAGAMPSFSELGITGCTGDCDIKGMRLAAIGTFEGRTFMIMPQLTFDFPGYNESVGVVLIEKPGS